MEATVLYRAVIAYTHVCLLFGRGDRHCFFNMLLTVNFIYNTKYELLMLQVK